MQFRILSFYIFLSLAPALGFTQNTDSLYREFKKSKNVLNQAKILNSIIEAWGTSNIDSADVYLDKEILLLNNYLENHKNSKEAKNLMADALMKKSFVLQLHDKIDVSRKLLRRALSLVKNQNDYELLNSILNNLAFAYNTDGNLDSAIYYYQLAVHYSEKAKNLNIKGRSLANLANTQLEKGNIYEAENSILESIESYKKIKKNEDISNSYVIAAQLYDKMGNTKKSLAYYYKGLAIAEKTKNDRILSAIYNDIGLYYNELGQKNKVLYYLKKALNHAIKLESVRQQELCYFNIASFYKSQNKFDSAMHFLQISDSLLTQIDVVENKVRNKNFYAGLLVAEKKYNSAIDIYLNTLFKYDEIGDLNGRVKTRLYLADCYSYINNNTLALKYALQALEINKKPQILYFERDIHSKLAKYYEINNNFKQAIASYKLYYALKDSIVNEDNIKELANSHFKYSYEKKQFADSVKFSQEKKQRDLILAQKNTQIEKEKTQRYALYGGLCLVIVFGMFMYNRFKVTNKQKKIIEEQKLIVDQKQTEVLDSIKYAKRIQDALLKEEVRSIEKLPQHFILHLPKDIVSGDFYWINDKEEFIYIAVADCTGHGVPGAFLTMLGTSYLNEITSGNNNPLPSEVLNQLRQKFILELSQKGNEGESKDGMDISLGRLNLAKMELDWAGANNPLWIINSNANEITEIKPDKQPIGYHSNLSSFKNNKVRINKNDSLYLFSDGYQDQFGGEKGKKLKAANLKKLIFEIKHLPMIEQRARLMEAFNNWKDHFEQVDDVCIVGIRL